jgi:hypothetical protein
VGTKPAQPMVAGMAVPVKPVMPNAMPTPAVAGGNMPMPVKPMAAVAPGGVAAPTTNVGTKPGMPVTPVKPVMAMPVTPGAPTPMKPSAATLAPTPPEPTNKSGTSIVKSAPPKETARITIKPSLPAMGNVRTGTNIPTVKPAVAGAVVAAGAGAAAVVAGAKAGEPTAKAKTPAAQPAVPGLAPIQYDDANQGSTTVSTICAGVLALLTWSTAGILLYSYMS